MAVVFSDRPGGRGIDQAVVLLRSLAACPPSITYCGRTPDRDFVVEVERRVRECFAEAERQSGIHGTAVPGLPNVL